ncbi:hypothetical protein NQ317_018568 [Molorchus minor]|uniref:C-type lectin domain-containing protein n=1 Tax=Molorchus minor TaxID=1323400 RepID=A0ABQ9JXE9_9CUCU|nr:hypothetical protein NQ317_018568 [Molorchus minor]
MPFGLCDGPVTFRRMQLYGHASIANYVYSVSKNYEAEGDFIGTHIFCFQYIMMNLSILLAALFGVAVAQFPNGRILEPPVPALCAQRTVHERTPDGKGYFFSWRDPATKNTEIDWLDGRNFCRKRCMDLVSLETSAENEWIKRHLVEEKVKYIWTSGRLCDFKGCERADLQPAIVNGWFWTAVLQKLAPATQRDQNDWSEMGGIGKPQPDNREAQQGGARETVSQFSISSTTMESTGMT